MNRRGFISRALAVASSLFAAPLASAKIEPVTPDKGSEIED